MVAKFSASIVDLQSIPRMQIIARNYRRNPWQSTFRQLKNGDREVNEGKEGNMEDIREFPYLESCFVGNLKCSYIL
jgi:hypothetical protein